MKHIFSDKTGTLTCNIMNFRKCRCVQGAFNYNTSKKRREQSLWNTFAVKSVNQLVNARSIGFAGSSLLAFSYFASAVLSNMFS